jgi:hypothetical protein
MRLHWLATVLRNADQTVTETAGWQTRGADTMNPRGIVVHHTAEAASSRPQAIANFLVAGRSDLAGPLCHLYLDRTGRWWVIAAGRANHAGRGGWKGLTGNSSVVGIECANTGLGELWPSDQLDALEGGLVAIAQHLNVPADMICGHKEWAPSRKIDPAGIDMGRLRSSVRERLTSSDGEALTVSEVRKLRSLIRSWESVASNPSFPQYLIPWYRNRKT